MCERVRLSQVLPGDVLMLNELDAPDVERNEVLRVDRGGALSIIDFRNGTSTSPIVGDPWVLRATLPDLVAAGVVDGWCGGAWASVRRLGGAVS